MKRGGQRGENRNCGALLLRGHSVASHRQTGGEKRIVKAGRMTATSEISRLLQERGESKLTRRV